MSFMIKIDAEAGKAKSEIADVEQGLNKATAAAGRYVDAAGRLREANGKFAQSGTAAGEAVAGAADKAKKGHEGAKAAAEGHGDALTKLIHLAEAYVAVHQVESVIDGYIEIRNKTNSVATSAANLNALMDEQFRIAQETRSGWEELAGTYQRISNAGRGLGLSQRAILDLTEELSMGMRLSGSSSREAAMTMMELTHAFTVGTLTGREFRVMMKDAPALMHELQVVSGKTGAEFAEMGKHGKFTAQTLVEWFDKAKDTIKDKFGQTIPTISEGFTLIRNAAQKFFGEAGLGSGVVQKLGEAMRFVADHM
jgi:tape measure domain-containing protein